MKKITLDNVTISKMATKSVNGMVHSKTITLKNISKENIKADLTLIFTKEALNNDDFENLINAKNLKITIEKID